MSEIKQTEIPEDTSSAPSLETGENAVSDSAPPDAAAPEPVLDHTDAPHQDGSDPGTADPGTADSNTSKQPGPDVDTPNANQRVEVFAEDLPLHCPMPGKRLWDSHPRVYLPVEDSGEQICPYCGTKYVMTGPVKASH